MSTAQREYMYAYTQGNYREMVWALLTNRRWMCDYTPKQEFFQWVEKSGNKELKDLWEYVQGLFWIVCWIRNKRLQLPVTALELSE